MIFQDHSVVMNPFDWVFTSAITVGVLTRFLEVFVTASSTQQTLIDFWQSPQLGQLGIADLLTLISIVILIIAVVDLLGNRKRAHKYLNLLTSMILVGYTTGINCLSDSLALQYGITPTL